MTQILLDLSFARRAFPEGINTRVLRCTSCDKKAPLVELTAEDVQRLHAPMISLVCAECRDKYRSAAHLEIRYSTRLALSEFGAMTVVFFSTIILFAYYLGSFRLSLPVGASEILFFAAATVFLTGLKMVFADLSGRYGLTRSLRWSLHSRYVMIGFSLVFSSVLGAFFSIMLV